MEEVVEHQAPDGEHQQVVVARGPGQVRQLCVGRLKGERDEGVETAGLILQLPQAQQMVCHLRRPLHMAV